ncbi:MmgE/PrpD family protein [Leekyejoonella antrihumi]|uniref:MmgE/PrpD family protein n=1 Tax=Leekyejoonella antrihumi TaxID=1660198 RepID=A0A563DXL0_9MICO|nr:MmgE/PrpD family protein [Leekyejoonella antrihumi]TWP34945.1 MmgE/PrpD family protein [Leekyejoonella antrihumi]
MIAVDLAHWAVDLGAPPARGGTPTAADLALADRSLQDTLACAIAARQEPIIARSRSLGEAGRWAVASHIVDFDDLHMPSTTHISTVCVPATLATGGGPRDYLAGAGVMARIGTALGWSHYSAGWHATTTSGAMGAAACAASALGLDAAQTATALALAVPASGGVRRAFGTDAKSLQVGFAVDAGLRAAALAADGASADPRAVDEWLRLVGGETDVAADLETGAPAVPDGLAIKVYPCCYALQRPIAAIGEIRSQIDVADVQRIVVRTPDCTVTPLVHHRPQTGLEGKFSLEYAVAAALLDDYCGFATFTDDAVQRPEARRLIPMVEIELGSGSGGLLAGHVELDVHVDGGVLHSTRLELPPGAPTRPPTSAQLDRKIEDCLAGSGVSARELSWPLAADVLRHTLADATAFQTTVGANAR